MSLEIHERKYIEELESENQRLKDENFVNNMYIVVLSEMLGIPVPDKEGKELMIYERQNAERPQRD